jgi:predicted GH43/DUF377 family glycosyl hydrolase
LVLVASMRGRTTTPKELLVSEILIRWENNPIIHTHDVPPSAAGLEVACVLNPGAFEYHGRVGLLLRVAERPLPREGYVATCVLDPASTGGAKPLYYARNDPQLDQSDPRVMSYAGEPFLTTLSHLRLAWSTDGRRFEIDTKPAIVGSGPLETFGVEDCRVLWMNERYWLTYTAVSQAGVAVGMASTTDWQSYQRHGVIFPPHNKDCCLFPRKINGRYFALHRPSGAGIGGHNIWIASSPDLRHFGDHRCIARTRAGLFDSQRVGANASPIETDQGWLLIYHGADDASQYGLGAMLLDRDEPWRVIGRTREPILAPQRPYETNGFFNKVVFSNGHIVRGDAIDIYYGAADTVICGCSGRIADILAAIEPIAH